MMTGTPRIGIVGAGYWGANLVRVCDELGVLDSVCDANPAILESTHKKYPALHLDSDFRALLQRPIDGVIIAAPVAVHSMLALEAIAAGKHVFVEKPLAMTAEDARQIVTAANEAGVQVMTGHVLLYHPAVRRLLRLINEGAIGAVRHIRSRRLSFGRVRAHENVWWSFAPHDVALVLEIFERERPERVRGSLLKFVRPNIADFAYADLFFKSGRTAHIEVNWLDPDKTARLDVFGQNGVITLIDSRNGAVLTLTPCGDRPDANGNAELWRDEPQTVSFEAGEPLKLEVQAFLRAITEGIVPITDGEEGMQVVEVLSMLGAQSTRPMEAIV